MKLNDDNSGGCFLFFMINGKAEVALRYDYLIVKLRLNLFSVLRCRESEGIRTDRDRKDMARCFFRSTSYLRGRATYEQRNKGVSKGANKVRVCSEKLTFQTI